MQRMQRLKIAIVALAMMLSTSSVWAQRSTEVTDADPQRGGWIALMMAIVLVMCMIAVSAISSRREHRD